MDLTFKQFMHVVTEGTEEDINKLQADISAIDAMISQRTTPLTQRKTQLQKLLMQKQKQLQTDQKRQPVEDQQAAPAPEAHQTSTTTPGGTGGGTPG